MLRHIRRTHTHTYANTHTFITRLLNVMCRWLKDKPFYTKYSHCDDDVPAKQMRSTIFDSLYMFEAIIQQIMLLLFPIQSQRFGLK